MLLFCLYAGLIVSILAFATTEKVASLIVPRKEGFSAIPRTIASMFWLLFGPFISLAGILIFLLFIALKS
ncbi:MAG: hypothetical protein AB7W16_10435 [Candidatus Obscuribacterales bacterium]